MRMFLPRIYITKVGIHRLLHDIPQFSILFLEQLIFILNQWLSIRAFGKRDFAVNMTGINEPRHVISKNVAF